MSAVKEFLAERVEAELLAQGLPVDDHAAYMETMAAIMEGYASGPMVTGYQCKACGGASPVGIGYWAGGDISSNAFAVTVCPCGYSVSNLEVSHAGYIHPKGDPLGGMCPVCEPVTYARAFAEEAGEDAELFAAMYRSGAVTP